MGNTLVPGKASEAELSRMMETYGAMLTGTCTVLLGDRHLAQDIVQETFVRAYKKMDSFRGERPESEKAWLTRIAVNLCRDERRKKWFRFEDRTIPVEMMTLSAPEASEEAQQLYAAVQTLPQKYREVILLRFYQDLTAPEIAEILHQATGTIYHKLQRETKKHFCAEGDNVGECTMKKFLTVLCALLLVPTLATANSDMVSISELRQQVEAMGQWTQNDTVNGKIIEINAPIKVPDVDELPVIIVSRLESDDEGLKQKISDGGELSYKDLSGMSIGKTDEQSIYNINIQQCRTRSYLCINDFWNYERENDVAQMYANDNAYSLADVKEKMGELFRSLYPCEDEIELQKAEFNICYLSKDEKEVENGNLVGIGEYSLTGNQVIAGIPILATAASGYKLEGKESRIEDEMRMMANTIFLYWRDEKEWALMTRGIVEEKETVEEDIKLCSLETVLECIRDAMTEGKIECVYSLELGYVLYAKSGETYTKKDKNAEFCLMPTWVVKCGYQNEIPIEPEEAELSAYDYMDNLGFQNVLINAQTGKMTDPKGAQKVYDTPKIIR